MFWDFKGLHFDQFPNNKALHFVLLSPRHKTKQIYTATGMFDTLDIAEHKYSRDLYL